MSGPLFPETAQRGDHKNVLSGALPDVANAPTGALDTNFLNAVRGAPQFTALGDSNSHADVLQNMNFLKRDETLNVLQASGMRHIFMERPPVLQKYADALAAGKISRDDFVEGMSVYKLEGVKNEGESQKVHEHTADLILGAKKRGMEVHFVDSNRVAYQEYQHPELQSYAEELRRTAEKKISEDPHKYKNISGDAASQAAHDIAADYFHSLPLEKQKRISELMLHERLSSDKQIAETMKDIAGNQRAVIFYGPQHFEGFEKEIGSENIRKIALTGKNGNPTETPPQGWSIFKVPDELSQASPKTPNTSRLPSPG